MAGIAAGPTVLVVNAGSSSLKLRVIAPDDSLVGSSDLPSPTSALGRETEEALRDLGPVDAVGHRIVHGGVEFTGAVRLDQRVEARLHALTDLAPLHQPKSLAALAVTRAAFPGVPTVACFDTAFHATLPPAAAEYALPPEWRRRWNLRRYGFHGLSHAYAARRAAELLGRPAAGLRLVSCHLGSGASLCAVSDGRSVDTTMGFTPLEGLVMGTRSGSLDPGLVIWLEEHVGMPPAELASTLEHRSGLLGLAGDSDMRVLEERSRDGDGSAELAISVYQHRLRSSIAAMSASLRGLDALVFTGGVGENSARVRSEACGGLAFLGVAIDEGANRHGVGDREVGGRGSRVSVLVLASREDLQIAREVRAVLQP